MRLIGPDATTRQTDISTLVPLLSRGSEIRIAIMTIELQTALDQARLKGSGPDVSEGMAWIFEDKPIGEPLGIFTVRFAREFCESDSLYVWRKL